MMFSNRSPASQLSGNKGFAREQGQAQQQVEETGGRPSEEPRKLGLEFNPQIRLGRLRCILRPSSRGPGAELFSQLSHAPRPLVSTNVLHGCALAAERGWAAMFGPPDTAAGPHRVPDVGVAPGQSVVFYHQTNQVWREDAS